MTSLPERTRSPRFKFALLDLFLTVALPLSTQIANVTGKGRPEVEQARETEGPITPATGAFAIWGPIFACLLVYGVQRTRSPEETEDSQAGALARVSLIGNLLWSLNAQYRDFGWQSLALIGASAATATGSVARYARLGGQDPSARRAGFLLAPLAGWLSVAAFANLEATQRFTQSSSQRVLTPPIILAMATASTVGGVVATKGNPLYSAAAAWGLGGIARKNAPRDSTLAAVALAGLAVVAGATFIVARRN
jgi:hypothetical protein